jgi:hypothetical protein
MKRLTIAALAVIALAFAVQTANAYTHCRTSCFAGTCNTYCD